MGRPVAKAKTERRAKAAGMEQSDGAERVPRRTSTKKLKRAGSPEALGNGLLLRGDHAGAAKHFRAACASSPTSLEPRLKLARCLLELGQTEAAMECLRAAVRGGPPSTLNMALKVLVSSKRGRFWLRPSAAVRALS